MKPIGGSQGIKTWLRSVRQQHGIQATLSLTEISPYIFSLQIFKTLQEHVLRTNSRHEFHTCLSNANSLTHKQQQHQQQQSHIHPHLYTGHHVQMRVWRLRCIPPRPFLHTWCVSFSSLSFTKNKNVTHPFLSNTRTSVAINYSSAYTEEPRRYGP